MPRILPDGERFVAFAFAAADMLVELDERGRIAFAAGAFRARLGRSPESLVGAAPTELLAAEDRPALAAALALMPVQGRLAHTSFRLGDGTRTPVSVSGLVLRAPPAPQRVCLAIAPLPAAPAPRLADAAALLREGEEQLAQGPALTLGVIELSQPAPAGLAGRLGAALAAEAAQGALAAEIGPGRYGLLPTSARDGAPDLAGLTRQIEAILAEERFPATVSSASLSLDRGGLSPTEAARALRHGLSAYARAGVEELRQAGLEAGLAGVMARIAHRAAGLRRAIAERRFRLEFQPIVDLAGARCTTARRCSACSPAARARRGPAGLHHAGRDDRRD
jgi:PAS domain S-box-containing protein